MPASANGMVTPRPAKPLEEEFPWHDPAIALDERLKLAEDKPYERKMMAAMAQLDCGACGYICQSYREAISKGGRGISPSARPAARRRPRSSRTRRRANCPADARDQRACRKWIGTHERSGGQRQTLQPKTGVHDRKNPFHAPLLECRNLTSPGSEKDVRLVSFSLRGSGLTYDVGDALGVYPENDPELVESILR